jgi:hypothetical protein
MKCPECKRAGMGLAMFGFCSFCGYVRPGISTSQKQHPRVDSELFGVCPICEISRWAEGGALLCGCPGLVGVNQFWFEQQEARTTEFRAGLELMGAGCATIPEPEWLGWGLSVPCERESENHDRRPKQAPVNSITWVEFLAHKDMDL